MTPAEQAVLTAIPRAGVWFVYGTDRNTYPIAVFPNELSARRFAMGHYGDVVFWPYGAEWSDRKDWTQ